MQPILFIKRARKRLTRGDAELLKFQTERHGLGRRASPFRSAPRGSRSEAPPSHPAALKDVGSELERMQGVIDDLLRERSQWTGGRHGDPASVTEVSILMYLSTIVDPRPARLIYFSFPTRRLERNANHSAEQKQNKKKKKRQQLTPHASP